MSEAPTFAVMETRLQALPHRARLMLEAAALLGGPCWSGLLIRLSRALDQHPRRTSPPHEALEYLVNAGHLLPVPDSQIGEQVEYILRRPEERHLLLDAIGSRRRREYQRVAAEWLEQQGDVEQSSELQALLARLLVGAGASHRGALVYGNAAETARSEGCRSKTIAYLREALDHLDPTDVRRRLEFLHDLGAALVEQGDHVGARRAFEDMLELADSLGLPNKQGAALNRLGRLCRECGDLSRARVFFQRACAAFDSAGDTRGLFATQDDLGKVMWLEGDWLGALPFLRSSLEGRKTIGDRRSLAVSLSNLALAWEQKGNLDSAREAIRMASRFFDAEHDDHGRCDTLLVLGQFATHRHDLSLAAAYFEQAANIAVAASDKTRLARCLLQLGETRLREDLLDVAASLLERAREVAESVEAWLDLAEAHRALAKVALKRERLRQARTHVRISLHLARRTHSRSQLSATLRTLAEVAAAGAWSSSTEGRAVRFFMLSIDLAKQTNNDLALAKGYRSFARYATRFPLPEIQRQSAILRDMSHELFGLHEVQS